MKKTLFVFALMVMVLAGCSKDADESYSLDGTTWMGVDTEDGVYAEHIFKFQKTTLTSQSFMYYDSETVESRLANGTYTYTAPLITIELDEGTTLTGTIKDSVMVIKWSKLRDFVKQ